MSASAVGGREEALHRISWLLLSVLLLGIPSFAQQVPAPTFEISGTYSYLRISSTKTNFNGASMSFALNPKPWLGLVADIGGYHEATPQGFPSGNLVSYLFGPRISYRKDERITPFAQILLGGVYDTVVAESAMAIAAGGGFDLKVAPHVAIRLGEADYLMTRFGRQTQNNVRISTGIVFRFGGE